MSKKADEALLKEIRATQELLNEFGFRAFGFDPGVIGYDAQSRTLTFDRIEWEWLKPILEELRARRASQEKK